VEVGPPRTEPGPVLEDGAVVRGADPPRLDRLLQKSYENLVAVTTFVKDGMPEAEELGRALTELEKTLAAVQPDAGAYARTWAAGASFFEEGSLALDALRRSGTTVEEVRRTVAAARALFRRSRAELATVATRLDAVAGHVGRLETRLTPERLARFGQAFDHARQLLAEVDLLLAEAEAVLALVERGEGTVGAFLRDEEWADDWKQLMKVMKTRPWTTVGHPP